jgi:hypothetical protein
MAHLPHRYEACAMKVLTPHYAVVDNPRITNPTIFLSDTTLDELAEQCLAEPGIMMLALDLSLQGVGVHFSFNPVEGLEYIAFCDCTTGKAIDRPNVDELALERLAYVALGFILAGFKTAPKVNTKKRTTKKRSTRHAK